MRWIALVVVIAPLVALAVGAVTGRVQARSCCSVADPRRDLRMAGVFDEVPPTASAPAPAPPVRAASPQARTAR